MFSELQFSHTWSKFFLAAITEHPALIVRVLCSNFFFSSLIYPPALALDQPNNSNIHFHVMRLLKRINHSKTLMFLTAFSNKNFTFFAFSFSNNLIYFLAWFQFFRSTDVSGRILRRQPLSPKLATLVVGEKPEKVVYSMQSLYICLQKICFNGAYSSFRFQHLITLYTTGPIICERVNQTLWVWVSVEIVKDLLTFTCKLPAAGGRQSAS